MLLCQHGANIHAKNRLFQRPIILSEDDTMIRLLSVLDKKMSVLEMNGDKRGSTQQGHRLSRDKQHARFASVTLTLAASPTPLSLHLSVLSLPPDSL